MAFQALVASSVGRKYVFHGSREDCFHSIVRNSLRVLSNTRLMTTGAAYGSGVYFGKDFNTSLGYCKKGRGVGVDGVSLLSSMLICEIAPGPACKDHGICYVYENEQGIATRYLLRF